MNHCHFYKIISLANPKARSNFASRTEKQLAEASPMLYAPYSKQAEGILGMTDKQMQESSWWKRGLNTELRPGI